MTEMFQNEETQLYYYHLEFPYGMYFYQEEDEL